MSDGMRRPLTEEERARLHVARAHGGLCGACGRGLTRDEPVWYRRLLVDFGYSNSRRKAKRTTRNNAVYWRGPVCGACAGPGAGRAAEERGLERCLACGRGVFHESAYRSRERAFCSLRCRNRYAAARFRERTAP